MPRPNVDTCLVSSRKSEESRNLTCVFADWREHDMRQRPARTTSTGFTDVARRGRNAISQEWKTNPNACLACETDAHGAVVRMRALETGGPLSGHRSGDSTQKEQNEEVRKVRVNSLALSRITDNGASYLAADWEWFVPVESRSCSWASTSDCRVGEPCFRASRGCSAGAPSVGDTADRPGFADSPILLGRGHIQIESGLIVGARRPRRWPYENVTLPQVELHAGLAPRVEVSLTSDGLVSTAARAVRRKDAAQAGPTCDSARNSVS